MTDRDLLSRIPAWSETCPHCGGSVRVVVRLPGWLRVWLAGCFPGRRVRVPSERDADRERRDRDLRATFAGYRERGVSYQAAIDHCSREYRLGVRHVRRIVH